ncbi:serine hydrolase [Tenacibaculum singaporense]|uniref:Class A beta-lactamase-related serine hydrolase n=1 Tax=Tenacibaculum singaporense TaxID=2358479 RepID=A0A3Q8RRD6_9FLAO|nr:serine hydrolase domain-containing protein [Tenacibaculum singaporense]AZJ35382.1 class A beta-lactamase-related serine hydrolase [Tenacibaculum singaporense]
MKFTYIKLVITIICIVILGIHVGCSPIQPDNIGNEQKSKAIISEYSESENLVNYILNELMKLPSMPPGVSLAISKNDAIIYTKGYGYVNLKTKEPVLPSTQFRMGSLSRIITITSLLKLIEEGKLSFNDTLEELLPNYPQKKYPITIKQLVTGLSGMENYSEHDKFTKSSYHSVDEALTVFSHVPLAHKPGEKYKYSTHSYTLLSKIIEKASNKTFPKVLNENIFSFLAMNSTAIENLDNNSSQMSGLFSLNREGANKGLLTEIITPKDYSYSWAGAGMISTPSDLVKLGNSYLNGFIKKETLNSVFEIQQLNSKDTIRQSIGWDKNWDMDNRKVFEQDRSAEGTRNIISVFPDQKLSIAIMTNAFRLWAIEETAHTLAIPFLTKPYPIKQPEGIFPLEINEDVRGKWVKRDGTLILNGQNDRLIINHKAQDDEIYQLVYLNRKNKYALIHPDGVLYSEINLNNKQISGKVMYYRGPNLHKTSTEPPYLKFTGSNKSLQ